MATILTDDIVVVFAEGHQFAHRQTIGIEEFDREPLVVGSGFRFDENLADRLETSGVARLQCYRSNDLRWVAEFVRNGLGCAVVRDSAEPCTRSPQARGFAVAAYNDARDGCRTATLLSRHDAHRAGCYRRPPCSELAPAASRAIGPTCDQGIIDLAASIAIFIKSGRTCPMSPTCLRDFRRTESPNRQRAARDRALRSQ